MKLLFPVFASLMLQYQVNAEFLRLKKCLMGFGKCKSRCNEDEKEVPKCKERKCCIGPKVIQLIKLYLRHEIPHIPDDDLIEMLKSDKNFGFMMLPVLPGNKSTSLFPNANSVIIPNASPVKSATTSTRTPRHITHTPTSTKSDSKQSRNSTSASPSPLTPPAPP